MERRAEKMEEVQEEAAPTRILVGVNQSSLKGYPHPSISSRGAFEWTLRKIVRSNVRDFTFLFLHVRVSDEDAGLFNDEEFGITHTYSLKFVPSAVSSANILQVYDTKPAKLTVSKKTLYSFDDVDSVYASPDDFKRLKDMDRRKGIHLLEYFVERCHQIGLNCEAWVKKGDPSEVICSEVKRVQPAFLVVGNRGLGPFQRVFVGTVSEFCVKHADCPVITIKRSAEETPEDVAED